MKKEWTRRALRECRHLPKSIVHSPLICKSASANTIYSISGEFNQNDYSNFGFYSDVWGGLCFVVHLVTPHYSFHLQLVCARAANSVHFAITNGVIIDLHWTVFYSAFTPHLFGSIKMDNAAFAKFLRFVVKAVGQILVRKQEECLVWFVCTL